MNNITSTQAYQPDLNGEAIPDVRITSSEAIQKYKYYIPLFFLFLLICIGLTFLYLHYTAPLYSTSINILVREENEHRNDLSNQILAELTGSGKTNIANELRIIQTATIIEKVVRKNNLNVVYYSVGNISKVELYDRKEAPGIIFKNIKDSSLTYEVQLTVDNNKIYYLKNEQKNEIGNNATINEKKFDFAIQLININTYRPNYIYKAIWYPPAKIAQALANQITAKSLDPDASIINLVMISETSAKAQDILNGLALEYNLNYIEEKNRAIDSTLSFINERLLLISGELGGVEKNLQNFRQQNNVIDIPIQGQKDMERLTMLRDKLDESQVKMQVANMISEYLNNPARRYDLVPSSLGIEDVTLLELVKGYNTDVLKRDELLKTMPRGNIGVVTLEGELDQLRGKIIENISNIKKTYQTTYSSANMEYGSIKGNIQSIPSRQKSLIDIERQQGIKEKLYLYLMEKREEAAISRASTVSNSAPLDPAKTSGGPVSPNENAYYAVAILLGLGIPGMLIFLKDILNDKVTTRIDIIKLTHTPVLGEIYHLNNKVPKIITGQQRSMLAEQFRMIRTNLSFFLKGEKSSVILLTSTMPNEGKTFCSMNLAAVLAMSGKRVVLLEFDLRKPKLSSALGIERHTNGITNYLTSDLTTTELLKPVPGFDNYFLISSGPVPPNPAELLLHDKMHTLFNDLKNSFDYIIIDSPPVSVVSDAKVLSTFSSVTLYIIRQRFTLKKQVAMVNELYVTKTFTNMALLVNDVIVNGPDSYYGYSKGYTYGNYNYDNSSLYNYNEEAKSKWWKFKKKSSNNSVG